MKNSIASALADPNLVHDAQCWHDKREIEDFEYAISFIRNTEDLFSYVDANDKYIEMMYDDCHDDFSGTTHANIEFHPCAGDWLLYVRTESQGGRPHKPVPDDRDVSRTYLYAVDD